MKKYEKQNLKRRLAKLNEEEKINKIKEIALEEQLGAWRKWGLAAYRAAEKGEELPQSPAV